MQARLGEWGGSCAVRIPRWAAQQLGLEAGEAVEMQIKDGGLLIKASQPHYALEDLLHQARHTEPPDVLDVSPLGEEVL